MRLVILRGGPSSQYELSLETGKHIAEALSDRHNVEEIFIDRQGVWHRAGCPITPESATRHADIVINALHGSYGEDGKLQQTLEKLQCRFTGSGSLSCVRSWDKKHTKEVLSREGIKVPGHVSIKSDQEVSPYMGLFDFNTQHVVKPAREGDSLSVIPINTQSDLLEAVTTALLVSPEVLVEEHIKGTEIKVGVVDGFRGVRHYALFPVEVVRESMDDIYIHADYSSEYEVPARITKTDQKRAMERAIETHKTLNLRDYSMIDMIVTPEDIYVIEVNALPPLTPRSPMLEALRAVGSDYEEFLEHVISRAIER